MGIGASGQRAKPEAEVSCGPKKKMYLFGSKASFICCLSSGTSVMQCRTQGKLSVSLKT